MQVEFKQLKVGDHIIIPQLVGRVWIVEKKKKRPRGISIRDKDNPDHKIGVWYMGSERYRYVERINNGDWDK